MARPFHSDTVAGKLRHLLPPPPADATPRLPAIFPGSPNQIPMFRQVPARAQPRSRRSPRLVDNGGWFLVVRLQTKAGSFVRSTADGDVISPGALKNVSATTTTTTAHADTAADREDAEDYYVGHGRSSSGSRAGSASGALSAAAAGGAGLASGEAATSWGSCGVGGGCAAPAERGLAATAAAPTVAGGAVEEWSAGGGDTRSGGSSSGGGGGLGTNDPGGGGAAAIGCGAGGGGDGGGGGGGVSQGQGSRYEGGGGAAAAATGRRGGSGVSRAGGSGGGRGQKDDSESIGGGGGKSKGRRGRGTDHLWTLMVHEVRGIVCFESAYGKYLCVEPDGKVVADRSWDNSWEQFRLERFADVSVGPDDGHGPPGAHNEGTSSGSTSTCESGRGSSSGGGATLGCEGFREGGGQGVGVESRGEGFEEGQRTGSSMPPLSSSGLATRGVFDGVSPPPGGRGNGGGGVSKKRDRFALRTYHGQYLRYVTWCLP